MDSQKKCYQNIFCSHFLTIQTSQMLANGNSSDYHLKQAD